MKHGIGGVSCADCYFRQELLCALQVETVCPTFRATVGRAPARPRQAQLVPVPQFASGQVPAADIPAPAAVQRDVIDTSRRVPSLVLDDPAGEPFSSISHEATFSVHEAAGEEAPVVTAREAANPRPAMRAAAARRDLASECVVQLEAQDMPAAFVASVVPMHVSVPAAAAVGTVVAPARSAMRSSRIAERIARRYPNAAALA